MHHSNKRDIVSHHASLPKVHSWVTSSSLISKLQSSPRKNVLASALQEYFLLLLQAHCRANKNTVADVILWADLSPWRATQDSNHCLHSALCFGIGRLR